MRVLHPETPPTTGGGSTAASRAGTAGRDALTVPATLWRIPAALVGGGVFALLSWFILHSVTLPAFNTSTVTPALATAFSFAVILVTAWLVWLWMRDDRAGRTRPAWRAALTEIAATLMPAGLVVTALGVPLSATKLYLWGIQVDQGFRTQFLNRMTEQLGNHDMNYFGLPTFYPLGWFWLGGRMANVLHMQGWEVYQPWAIVSLAAAGSALTPVWRKLTSSLPLAAAIAGITIAVILTKTADEPYAAIVAMFVPAAAVASARALRGSQSATAGLAVYLGLSATFYTLYTAISALTVVVLAAVIFLAEGRKWTPVKHLLAIGTGSIVIALITWGPYLYRRVFGGYAVRSTANHFLPNEGTVLPLPFFSLSVIGALSLAGVVFLIARARDARYSGLLVALAVCYFWALASMVAPLAGTSLLGFRVEVLITLLFVTAGALGAAEAVSGRAGTDLLPRMGEGNRRVVAASAAVLAAASVLTLVQQIPGENETHIDQAYGDTDGNGDRADKRPADAGRYYNDVAAFITDHGRAPADTVVYTDEVNFMAYHPFYGFNAITSHYANPLGEFDLRNEDLAAWAEGSFGELSDPAKLTGAMDSSRWRAPDAFIFRGDLDNPDEPWKSHISHDIFPNQPNVRYDAILFNPAAFDSPAWDVKQIGPFVVAVRNK
ncbi:arabinofuranosyltransferase [Corynebacterium sp. UBA2622]|uniref:arabinofuranosyltransferase n=1 Tax=Corynebacterium sp. UBA2622 TaxID=1946393 RepID=UPI0025C4ACC2|nr:arabinofuranosyltransferase [Corynebacterium sp. UBA2622]